MGNDAREAHHEAHELIWMFLSILAAVSPESVRIHLNGQPKRRWQSTDRNVQLITLMNRSID